ncbi:MAG: UbiH/UbiF family hydroxylase, partial [Paracoccaceae bacterium]
MARERTDILVSGGGLAGQIATCALAAEGFDVTCVDPLPPVTDFDAPDSDLRSTAFLVPSIAVLERAGLWRMLAPFAQELRSMRLVDAGGPEGTVRETADFDPADIGAGRFGYNLPNWLLRREISRTLGQMPGARLVAPAGFATMVP